jgi:hypothetical protein
MILSDCSWAVCGDLGGVFGASFGRALVERTRWAILGGSDISSNAASESDTLLAANEEGGNLDTIHTIHYY